MATISPDDSVAKQRGIDDFCRGHYVNPFSFESYRRSWAGGWLRAFADACSAAAEAEDQYAIVLLAGFYGDFCRFNKFA